MITGKFLFLYLSFISCNSAGISSNIVTKPVPADTDTVITIEIHYTLIKNLIISLCLILSDYL